MDLCSKLFCPRSDIPPQPMQVHFIYLLMLEEFWKPAKNYVVSDAFARTLLPDPSVSCQAEYGFHRNALVTAQNGFHAPLATSLTRTTLANAFPPILMVASPWP